MLAASISDVEADTGYVEDPMVFALCKPTIDYENARSEMASKYVTAAVIFGFLWQAYEAAVSVTATDELRALLKGRLGERGRRLFEARPEVSPHFEGLRDVLKLTVQWCEAGGNFRRRLDKIQKNYHEPNFVFAAELCREFRNFVVHGEDQVPEHPEYGDAVVAIARLCRFYAAGRLTLYLIQGLAWISDLPPSEDELEEEQFEADVLCDLRKPFTTVQFATAR